MKTIDVARYYHSLGINCIPWKHRQKGGGLLIPSWYKYQVQRVTDAEIEEWFQEDCGIAIVTGQISNLTVVDDDARNGQKRLNSACVARSGGGGYHYYYRYTPRIKTGRRADMHLEVKGDGALIYAYPTIHESGTTYEFENGIESLELLQPFPESDPLIIEYLGKMIKDTRERDSRVYTQGYTEYFAKGEGDRDNSMKELCLMLWKKGMSPGQVYSIVSLVNTTYHPPLEDKIVRAKVESTFRGLGEKKDNTIAIARRDEPKTSPLKNYKGTEVEEAYRSIMQESGEGISTGFLEIDKYFRLFPKHLYMVTAGTHIGKTTFAGAVAMNVARMGKRVTFFALEDGLYTVPSLLKTGAIPHTFTLVDCDVFPTPNQIMNHIEEFPSDFVVVDHIHFLSSDDKKESMKDMIIDITKNLKLLTKKLNIPIMSLVHIRKQEKTKDTPPLIDDMKDAQELGGLANVICILHRKRIPAENMIGGQQYHEQVGTLSIPKAKAPGAKTGMVAFSITDQVFSDAPYQSQLQVVINNEPNQSIY